MKIVSVDVTPVSQVVNPKLAIVSAAGKHPESHYLIVTIHSDEGHTGQGEATVVPGWSGESQAGAQHYIRELLSPLLIGKDPLHVQALADSMDRVLIDNPFTKAAVEMALVDLATKSLRVPANILLGGPRRPAEIPLKFSIGAFSPSEAARVAKHAVSIGLKAAKIKVGLDVAGDIARVEAVRQAVGDEFRVAVDANSGWTESDTVRAIPHLEKLGVNALEQPLRRGDFRGCARLRKRTSIPIMLDESVFTRQHALEAIQAEACDLISIYPGKTRCLGESHLKISKYASATSQDNNSFLELRVKNRGNSIHLCLICRNRQHLKNTEHVHLIQGAPL
jgi:L-alanine-DL-glutamate epimerase-like enolase superfamily enzyme